jgi:hypothetical protein
MEVLWQATLCKSVNSPDDCPVDEKNAAQDLGVVGVSFFMAIFGAVVFLLAPF